MERLSINEKIALSDYRLEKAKEALKDGVLAFENKSFKVSVNRAYYAVFHSIRALLILKGIDPVTHDGAKTMFSLHFIKAKLLPAETLKIFNHLSVLRRDVDYGDFEEINTEDAKIGIEKVKNFIEITETVRKKLLKKLKS